MNKCLITKLNGVSDNSDLLRIGEMRVHFDKSENPTTSNRGKNFMFTKDSQLEIIGDAYFTDETLSTNLGKKITITKDSPKSVYVSNSDCDVCILDKYSLLLINDWVKNTTNDNGNFSFSIEDLKYSVNFYQIYCSNGQVTGDISALKNLTALVNLVLGKTQVTGDIANLRELTALTKISMDQTQLSGDIASLKGLTALTIIGMSNEQVPLTGNISQLSTLSNCTYIRLNNSKLTGDLALLPSKCRYASFFNDKGSVFTWSTRPSSAKIIAIEGNASLTNIDKMLQDQAQCQVGFTSSDAVSYKTISVAGNRTSASDDAVAALQQKGYTIRIAKV